MPRAPLRPRRAGRRRSSRRGRAAPARMHVDPADAGKSGGMFLQDAPHVQQRGRRAIAAIEQAVGMRVLPARDGLGVGGQAMLGDVALLLALVGFGRRPGLGQQHGCSARSRGSRARDGHRRAGHCGSGRRCPRRCARSTKAIRIDRVHQQQATPESRARASIGASSSRASWQPEPQKPSAPCVADVMISSRSALASPISATSVDRASSRAPRASIGYEAMRAATGGGKKALARLSVAVGKIAGLHHAS